MNENTITIKTEHDLYEIAKGIEAGTIFTNRHCRDISEVRMVFMVLAFMEKKQMEEFIKEDIGLIYEHINKAGPRSCNGLPNFFSLQKLTKDETEKVLNFVDSLKKIPKLN